MEKKLQPKLRFKEFSGELSRKTLGDITTLMQSGLSRQLSDTDIGLPVMRSNNLINGKINIDDIKYWHKFDDKGAKLENYFLKKNDLLVNFINSLAQIGKSSIYSGELKRNTIFTTNIMRLNFKSSVDPKFIFNFFQTKNYDNFIQSITKPAVNQASFTTVDFKTLKLNLPPLPEQEKIASFLSSVDSKIEKLEKKKELLSQYKKGIMQKVFSQEIRFKDKSGEEYPQWEEKKLGEVGAFNPTNSFSRALLNYESGDVYNIHYGDIYTKFSTHLDLEKYELPYINKDVSLDKVKEESFCIDGDIIIADASESYEDIGSAVEISNIKDRKVLAGLHTFLLRPNKNYIVRGYMEQYLQSSGIRNEIKKIATGISVLGISKTNLGKLKLNLPCLEEQQKIANFLSSIDKKIELVEKEIEKNKEFKKGLLQQMFV